MGAARAPREEPAMPTPWALILRVKAHCPAEQQVGAWQSRAKIPCSRDSSLLCLLQHWPGLGEEGGCVQHCCWKCGRAGGPLGRVLVASGPRFPTGLFPKGKTCRRQHHHHSPALGSPSAFPTGRAVKPFNLSAKLSAAADLRENNNSPTGDFS